MDEYQKERLKALLEQENKEIKSLQVVLESMLRHDTDTQKLKLQFEVRQCGVILCCVILYLACFALLYMGNLLSRDLPYIWFYYAISMMLFMMFARRKYLEPHSQSKNIVDLTNLIDAKVSKVNDIKSLLDVRDLK